MAGLGACDEGNDRGCKVKPARSSRYVYVVS